MKKQEFIHFILIPAIIGIGFVSALFGMMIALDERREGKSGCEYKSYITMYNPFYIGACELLRDRTK